MQPRSSTNLREGSRFHPNTDNADPSGTPYAVRRMPTHVDLSRAVDAVVFDCYGTLMDVTDAHFIDVFDAICAANRFSLTGRELWDRWLAESRRLGEERGRDAKDPLAAPEPEFMPLRVLWRQVFERTFGAMECEADPVAAYLGMHELLRDATPYPETIEVLEALRQRYQVALLSNADDDHLQICLSCNGLAFEQTISSESAASYKPHPGIFRRTAELLRIEPERILYVGDSPVADMLGANKAGMRTAWVNRAGGAFPEKLPAPDLELRDLRDLLPALLSVSREA